MIITSKYFCDKYNGKWAMFLRKQLEVGRIDNVSIDHSFNSNGMKYIEIWAELINKRHYDIYQVDDVEQYLQHITNDFLIFKYVPDFLNKKIEQKIMVHKNDRK